MGWSCRSSLLGLMIFCPQKGFLSYHSMVNNLAAMGMFLTFILAKPVENKFILSTASLTFGVYLLHPLLIFAFDNFVSVKYSNGAMQFLMLFVVPIFSYGIVFLLKRISIISRLV